MKASKIREQRILWVSEKIGSRRKSPTKIDRDVAIVLTQLLTEAYEREVSGLVCGVLRPDGRVELVTAGHPYSVPLIASGLAARLQAMTDGWFSHPGEHLPYVEVIDD